MKIKKPMTVKAPAAAGGAAIADRFKLDEPGSSAKSARTVGRKSTAFAFTAAIIALGVAGGLAYMLYLHWQYLMPA